MKTKFLLFLSAAFFTFSGFAQDLFILKQDYNSNLPNALSELNKTTGAIIDTYGFSITNLSSPTNLAYDASANELYFIIGYEIVKYSITTKTETYFSLPDDNTDYWSLIIANERLFIIKQEFNGSWSNVLSELDKTTGAIIDNYVLSTTNYSSPKNLAYDASANELYCIIGNQIVKYNIATKTETYFSLPSDDIDYWSVIIANERLFVIKQEFNSSWSNVLSELDKTTGTIIDNHVLSTTNYSSPKNLAYDASANELYCIIGNQIVKYNIATKTETYFSLSNDNIDYWSIIIVNTNTGVNEILHNKALKPIKAYDLFGKEVPLNTTNQIIIIEYKNGFREKVYRN